MAEASVSCGQATPINYAPTTIHRLLRHATPKQNYTRCTTPDPEIMPCVVIASCIIETQLRLLYHPKIAFVCYSTSHLKLHVLAVFKIDIKLCLLKHLAPHTLASYDVELKVSKGYAATLDFKYDKRHWIEICWSRFGPVQA